jgi:hypothetical protein
MQAVFCSEFCCLIILFSRRRTELMRELRRQRTDLFLLETLQKRRKLGPLGGSARWLKIGKSIEGFFCGRPVRGRAFEFSAERLASK